jgi:hypothetical protein
MKTKVIFRMPIKEPQEVVAIFPDEAGTNDPRTCMSYQHTGQHGSAMLLWALKDCRPATIEEYEPLKKELERIGYNLHIMKRVSSKSHSVRFQKVLFITRTPAQIRRGTMMEFERE